MKRIILIIFLIALLIGGALAWKYYHWIYGPQVPAIKAPIELLIPMNTNYETLINLLNDKGALRNEASFRWVADKMKFGDPSVKSGRYLVQSVMSNRALISLLRSGNQSPINLTIGHVRKLEDLAGRVSKRLELDSTELLQHVYEKYIPGSDFTRENILGLFIPNTYELFWNTSHEKFIQRMEVEHSRFWNSERKRKCEALELTPAEVYTLASIVERETQAASEKSTIARVYLNRIRKGMLLQADPTVIHAVNDFTIRRVLHKHLAIDSPYNTYKYAGLPPGPIYMPSIEGIDAVLNAEEHNFLYFCVKPNGGGTHSFAATLAAHNRNARAYHRWLNQNGIR